MKISFAIFLIFSISLLTIFQLVNSKPINKSKKSSNGLEITDKNINSNIPVIEPVKPNVKDINIPKNPIENIKPSDEIIIDDPINEDSDDVKKIDNKTNDEIIIDEIKSDVTDINLKDIYTTTLKDDTYLPNDEDEENYAETPDFKLQLYTADPESMSGSLSALTLLTSLGLPPSSSFIQSLLSAYALPNGSLIVEDILSKLVLIDDNLIFNLVNALGKEALKSQGLSIEDFITFLLDDDNETLYLIKNILEESTKGNSIIKIPSEYFPPVKTTYPQLNGQTKQQFIGDMDNIEAPILYTPFQEKVSSNIKNYMQPPKYPNPQIPVMNIPNVQDPTSYFDYQNNIPLNPSFDDLLNSFPSSGNTFPDSGNILPTSMNNLPTSVNLLSSPLNPSYDDLLNSFLSPGNTLPTAMSNLPTSGNLLSSSLNPSYDDLLNSFPSPGNTLPASGNGLPTSMSNLPTSGNLLASSLNPSNDNLLNSFPSPDNTLPTSMSNLQTSINLLPSSINQLPQNLNFLPPSINHLAPSKNNLPTFLNSLQPSVNGLPQSFNVLQQSVNTGNALPPYINSNNQNYFQPKLNPFEKLNNFSPIQNDQFIKTLTNQMNPQHIQRQPSLNPVNLQQLQQILSQQQQQQQQQQQLQKHQQPPQNQPQKQQTSYARNFSNQKQQQFPRKRNKN